MFPISDLPDELLLHVLSWLPGSELIKNCCLVNKHWNEVINQQKLWHDKCVQIGYYNPEYSTYRPTNFKKYFFINPYTRNLIKNPCAEEQLDHWIVDLNAGDGFQCESTPIGSDPISNFTDEVKGNMGCWASSYGWCIKHQLIDLLEEGCEAEILDKIRPDIEISEWFSARFDCAVTYWLQVFLLDKDKEKIDSFEFMESPLASTRWYHIKQTFKSYPSGLRYIFYKHRGKDNQFWAGHYGAKFTLSTVKFKLEDR